MARRKSKQDAPGPASRKWDKMGRLVYLTELLKQVHLDMDQARADGSWQALSALTRQAVSLRNEIETARDQESIAVRDPRTMSPDEWRAYLEGDAASRPDSDLEVYVAEYQRRTSSHLVHPGGRTG
jgi:hypothetical protein